MSLAKRAVGQLVRSTNPEAVPEEVLSGSDLAVADWFMSVDPEGYDRAMEVVTPRCRSCDSVIRGTAYMRLSDGSVTCEGCRYE